MQRYILSLSGGLDSTVLLASLLNDDGCEGVIPVFFRYGSKHNAREEKAASAVASYYGLDLLCVDLQTVFGQLSSALLTHDSRAIPKAAYDKDSMALTVVPGRNLIFASVLAALAESRKFSHIALATHAGDHALYPDCRPPFNQALASVIHESSDGTVTVVTPFSSMSKADIVARGIELGSPFQLTRSCYESGELACGTCGTCAERLEAFMANAMADPVLYEAGFL